MSDGWQVAASKPEAPTVQFIVEVGAQRLVGVCGRVHAYHDRRGVGLSEKTSCISRATV